MDEKRTNKKSIIDQVLEDKQKRKEEQERKQREYNQHVQCMRAEMHAYVNTVLKKLRLNKPVYTPRGQWIGDAKWSVESGRYSFEAVAKEKLSKKLLIFSGKYVQFLDLEKVNNLFSEMIQKVDASLFNLVIAKCCVVDDCEDEKVKTIFSTYDHYGFFPFLYIINQKKIWYNQSNEKIEYLASWFNPYQHMVQLNDLIQLLTDSHNILTLEKIQERFDFNKKEAMKMIQSLVKKELIFHLKGNEYGVNEWH